MSEAEMQFCEVTGGSTCIRSSSFWASEVAASLSSSRMPEYWSIDSESLRFEMVEQDCG